MNLQDLDAVVAKNTFLPLGEELLADSSEHDSDEDSDIISNADDAIPEHELESLWTQLWTALCSPEERRRAQAREAEHEVPQHAGGDQQGAGREY